ncbi:hypothetical protein JG688_00001773 [Phytophthora aleatoria]|uniref:Rab3-GAP regulatory subunit N-terminal domain-containing protein n=1 Tax=Phytophthora aleatoria TaxID=2496075 RepID=A0A8J5IVK0_9STRA|nr:hypothetical protein JG688_00001773 [Phytophthora aleatoria]
MASSAAPAGSKLPLPDSEDALAVTLRVDSSSLRSSKAPDAPVSLYDDPRVRVDVAEDLTLLLGFEHKIYSVGVQEDMENDGQTTPSLHVVVDADSIHLEEDEHVADVKWLDRERFCAGYTSGIVRIFSRVGKILFEQKLHGSAVLKLDVNRNAATIMAPRRASVMVSSEPDMEGELWVLYADSTVAIIQISEILAKLNSVFGPAQASKFRKYSLREQKDIVAAIPCGPVRPTIFQSHSRLGVYTIVSAGSAPFLAFYQAGNDQNSIIHLAHIATAIASRAAGAVWNFATSWGWRRDAGESTTGEEGHVEYTQLGAGAIDAAAEHVPAPIGTTRSINEDERRRCRVLVLSPTGRLAAVSDTLGRILLVDTSRMLVIRMWKGYRNAQCGWMQGSEGARRPPGLYLVIYSAQRGIVEVWRARYGPRVFSFAVGNRAKLFTQFDPVSRKTKCVVLCETSDNVSELIELKPGLPNASILMKYFTQNKLQEENFLLHQVIGGLQAFVKKRRADATRTLEQDSLDPLLEDIGNLSSSTTIQTLLDVLLNAEMALLNSSFLLKALEKLQLSLVEIFNSCWKTPKLFHGFVLSEHCGWGEKQSAKHAEEDTLGKYSSAGSGARWVILQDCIAKTVHLSLRLGKVGRLSVDAVEHVDDIMRSIAVMQINDGHEPGEDDAAVQLPKDHIEVSVGDDGTDGWVATMENCRKAAQMKNWAAVLRAYQQFANKDSLCCFRVGILCAAWNAERSDMRQLEDALLELDCVASLQVKAAMAAYIWERYIRVHVVTLITFWEESSAGRKPQRGLQPQVARRFFGIIRSLLVTLSNALKAIPAVRVASTAYGQDEVESDYDDETSDADVESDDDEDENMSRIAVFKMESLTQSIKWRCRVKDLHLVFRQRWPPSHDTSTLMQALQSFKFDMASVSQIADHISLVMLLDSFAATAVTPISVVKLFSNNGRYLCRPDSFLMTQQIAPSSEEETKSVTRDRTRFLKELLRHDETLGFALAEAFGLPLEMIREEYVLFLYQSGRDERADLAIEKMQRPERLVLKLGAIARARLSLILRRMKTEAEYAAVMSMLPADTFSWVISDSKPPLVADPLVEKLDLTPSLTSTHYLLLKCLAMIPPTGEEFEKVSAMSVLVKDVISQVKLHS